MSKNYLESSPNAPKIDKQQFIQMEVSALKRYLEGKVLTIVDASFNDNEQRKAVKDLVRDAIWSQEYFTESIVNYILGKPMPIETRPAI